MNKTKVVVFIDGGRVDNVLSNWPVEIVIVDYDLEGLDDGLKVIRSCCLSYLFIISLFDFTHKPVTKAQFR